VFNNFFFPESRAVYEIMWKNIVERGRPQVTVWRMRVACWIPKATNTHIGCVLYIYIYKGKAVPLQVRSGPEGSRKLRFPYYMTTAQDGGKVVSPTHRPPLPSGNAPGTHFC